MRSDVAPRPAISVLVPCFNDGLYLDAALGSIAAQSCGELEVIVSDDASIDDSPRIAESWAARDPRFRCFRNPANLGMTENWNRALRAAKGELVAKLDADDLFRPDALHHLVAGLDATPAALASFCRAEVGNAGLHDLAPWPGDARLRAAGFDPALPHVVRGRVLWQLSLDDVQLWHSNAFLVRRSDLLRLGGFDERWSCASDTALMLRLLAEDRPIVHVPQIGVHYRRREGSVSAAFEREGWKVIEGALVRLDALARDSRRLGPLPLAARQAWWQNWQAWRTLARCHDLWDSMPETTRLKLERAARAASLPPLGIRALGWLRLQGWSARQRLGRKSKSGSRR